MTMTKAISRYVYAATGAAGAAFIWFAIHLLHIGHRIILERSSGGLTWWLSLDAPAILLLLYVIYQVTAWKARLSVQARGSWRIAFIFCLLGVACQCFQRGVSDCFPGWPCSQMLKYDSKTSRY